MDKDRDSTLIDNFLDCVDAVSKAKAHCALFALLSTAIREDISLRQAMQRYEIIFPTETFAENGDYYLQAEKRRRSPSAPPITRRVYDKMVEHILDILHNKDL